MRQAFEDLGCEVYSVFGNATERRQRLNLLKGRISDYSLLYSENSTLPLRLVEPSHLPLYPSPDYALFRTVAAKGLPVGVFYRDFHWRRPGFARQIGLLKYGLAYPFYCSEVSLYLETTRTVFVPSLRTAAMLPRLPRDRIRELPPGGEIQDLATNPGEQPLKVVYVGNALPPVYDLRPLLQIMHDLQNSPIRLRLTVPDEARLALRQTRSFPPNTEFKAASGEGIAEAYAGQDLAIVFLVSQYAGDTVSLKLFEAVGYGLPVIALKGTRCGELVEQERLGWCVEIHELPELLRHLTAHRKDVGEKREQVLRRRERHSWQARARQAIECLLEGR